MVRTAGPAGGTPALGGATVGGGGVGTGAGASALLATVPASTAPGACGGGVVGANQVMYTAVSRKMSPKATAVRFWDSFSTEFRSSLDGAGRGRAPRG